MVRKSTDQCGDRWLEPIRQSLEWTPIGTLVNPAHALDLPVFDSYYVFLIAQAGPLLLMTYLILLLVLGVHAAKIWNTDRDTGALPLSTSLVLSILGVSQNLMTGLTGRYFLTLAIVSIVVCMTEKKKECQTITSIFQNR